jgi:hypothetical protein
LVNELKVKYKFCGKILRLKNELIGVNPTVALLTTNTKYTALESNQVLRVDRAAINPSCQLQSEEDGSNEGSVNGVLGAICFQVLISSQNRP